MSTSTAALIGIRRPVHIDLVQPRGRERRGAFLRDFAALGGLFGVLYGWFWLGSALAA